MSKQGKDWVSFDGREVDAGQVLVPQMVTIDYARSLGADMRNLRTWEKAGVSFTVMFIPVISEMEEEAWRVFHAEENELLDEKLGPNRKSRCMISQPDGCFAVCPKERKCSGCLDRGKYEKEDKSLVSLDDLTDDNYLPADGLYKYENKRKRNKMSASLLCLCHLVLR